MIDHEELALERFVAAKLLDRRPGPEVRRGGRAELPTLRWSQIGTPLGPAAQEENTTPMRRHRFLWSFLLLPACLAGCSTTVGSRFGGTPQAKSIAVVGDRPQPATAGEPGGKVAASDPEPEPRLNPKTRISGRVVDNQGEPVPNATVRLADGGSKGGKDIRAKTDRSGAFTLNGLRPGSSYSLIAETEDAQGSLSGRVLARTAETGVEISVASETEVTESNTAIRRPSRTTRAKPISNLEEREPSSTEGEKPSVNGEDVGSPVEEAAPLDPGPPPAQSSRPRVSAPQSAAGWKNTTKTTNSRSRSQDDEIVASSTSENSSRPRRAAAPVDLDSDEEGPNPLPPAIEPGGNDPSPASTPSARGTSKNKVGSRISPKASEAGEIALAPEARLDARHDQSRIMGEGDAETLLAAQTPPTSRFEPDLDRAPTTHSPALAMAEPTPAPSIAVPPNLTSPPAMPPLAPDPVASLESPPPTAAPPALSSTTPEPAPSNPAPRPVFASQPPAIPAPSNPAPSAEYNPFVLVASAPPAVGTRVASPAPLVAATTPVTTPLVTPTPAQDLLQASTASSLVPDDALLLSTSSTVPRKKWGEVAATDRSPVTIEATKASSPGLLGKRARKVAEKGDPSITMCNYDARLRKLTDFRLPDLEGKAVQFKDIDADYVLLDFWGTWCPPCLDAIPHLVALQKKYGPTRLKVVGIACEDGPPEQRKAKVDQAARKLGINYPVLLSALDGQPCPVQQAFQIQSFPTLILVDRRGNIVWRSTGATPAAEVRLDRVLASQMSRGDVVRR